MYIQVFSNLKTFISNTSLEGLFPDDPVNNIDDTSPQLKYFHSSQSEGINSGDVAFLAGWLRRDLNVIDASMHVFKGSQTAVMKHL